METINEKGKQEIREFLAANHKLGGDHFTDSMIDAWVAEAEFQLREGNPPIIEIKSWDSVSGHTMEYTVSDEGVSTYKAKLDDWLNAGYKGYEVPARSEAFKLADFLLQKRIEEKYYITVCVYDHSRYPDYPEAYTEQYNFMPTSRFSIGEDKPFFEVSMNGEFTVEECEMWLEKLWNTLHGGEK